MKLCEQCGQHPPAFPGSEPWAGGKYCESCLHEKANLVLDVFQVISHYGVQEEI